MITPYLPFPLVSGGQIRTYNLLKNLSRKHQITLLSFIRSQDEKKYIPNLKKFCPEVKVFMKRPPWSLTSLLLAGITFYPLVVCMYLKRKMKEEIDRIIKSQHFDLIHAETFYVMPNIPENNIPTILVEQTIEYLVYKHYTHNVKLLPLKLLMKWDVFKIFSWETRYWNIATRVVAMSAADRDVMKKLNPKLNVDLVPNGVDTVFFTPKKISRLNPSPTVLFVGNFKWLQNREAVSVLVKDIWPIIVKKLPKARLWIVGKNPTNDILRFRSDSIKVSADIDNINTAYSASDLLLAPIYGPGGTRYKILEAMATGIPVVTTPTGIEGLDVKHGNEALIKNTTEELALETIKVLTNIFLYKKLVRNGRYLIEKRFNWKIIAADLDRIYQKAYEEKKN